jgi:hypothetical protein
MVNENRWKIGIVAFSVTTDAPVPITIFKLFEA